jgi:hypothetical protein
MPAGVRLSVVVEGLERKVPLGLTPTRIYNMAFTRRNPELMALHLEEVKRIGIPQIVVDVPPAVVPIGPWAVTTCSDVPVFGPSTTAEVEFVVAQQEGKLYLGVGSDHTSRPLQARNICWSKTVCPNVLAPTLWPLEEVASHWDDLVIESHVVVGGERILYQRGDGASFWPPDELLARLAEKVTASRGDPRRLGDFLAFSGTVAAEQNEIRLSDEWEFALADPVLARTIRHGYRAPELSDTVRDLPKLATS